MSEFDDVEAMAGALLRQLSSSSRRALFRRMAGHLAKTNRTRVRANVAPDGSKFDPRKPQQAAPQSNRPAAFLYPSGGQTRRVEMASYAIEKASDGGYQMTGFDKHAGGLRTFLHSRVTKWLTPPEATSGGKARRRPRLRSRAMFRRLSSPANLKASATDAGFWVGFTGRAAQVAKIHHHGLRDRPSLRAKAINYPKRELLGVPDADRQALLDMLISGLE